MSILRMPCISPAIPRASRARLRSPLWPRIACLLLPAACLLAAAGPARGAPRTAAEPASAADLEQLRGRLEELSRELAELGAERAAASSTAELERRIDVLSRELERLQVGEGEPKAEGSRSGLGPAASKVYGARKGVSIGGYGELTFEAPSGTREDGSPSGRSRQIDFLRAVFYGGYKFDDRWLFNSEVEIEHASTGEGGEVALEFAYLDFLWRPGLNARAGLLLLPVGFLNELHEPPVYLGARRPRVETRILPSTWRENGAGVWGDLGDRLSYRAYLVNGLDAAGFSSRGLRDGRQDGARARADHFAFAGRVDVTPRPGSLVGGSLYLGNSAQDKPDLDARTTIFELHGELRERGLEARVLYARASLDEVAELNRSLGLEGGASVGSRLEGGYLQVGYDVLNRTRWHRLALIPYLRWERLDTQAEVPAGFTRDPASRETLVTTGVAFRPHPQMVLKVDYQDVSNRASTGVNQLQLQLGYLF